MCTNVTPDIAHEHEAPMGPRTTQLQAPSDMFPQHHPAAPRAAKWLILAASQSSRVKWAKRREAVTICGTALMSENSSSLHLFVLMLWTQPWLQLIHLMPLIPVTITHTTTHIQTQVHSRLRLINWPSKTIPDSVCVCVWCECVDSLCAFVFDNRC